MCRRSNIFTHKEVAQKELPLVLEQVIGHLVGTDAETETRTLAT
jgi:hypothetical protein